MISADLSGNVHKKANIPIRLSRQQGAWCFIRFITTDFYSGEPNGEYTATRYWIFKANRDQPLSIILDNEVCPNTVLIGIDSVGGV